MKKWFLKNKGYIFNGILILIIFEISKSIIPFNKIPDGGTIFNLLIKVIGIRVSIEIPVFYALLFVVFAIVILRVSKKFKIRNRKFRIIKATYGTPGNLIDITRELNDAVIDNKLKIVLSNNIAGDPQVGTVKKGWITYRYNGKEFNREFTENGVIDLP